MGSSFGNASSLGLAWLGLAWLGLAWLGLAWLDLALRLELRLLPPPLALPDVEPLLARGMTLCRSQHKSVIG
ncbi:hypothetical protein SynBMKMC1_00253 [Synechococcus sp. BMK-MC-1]|nr:hypothetical protein SynBMKMC1_00253 [Synechococcus sp. BMK-MC-1]